jgi:trk system potassium uptake protein
LSRGITGSLTVAGKWIIIGLMFFGRVGPAVIGMAFFTRAPTVTGVVHEPEDIAI